MIAAIACASSDSRDPFPDAPPAAQDPPAPPLAPPGASCTGRRCDVPKCDNGTTTAIEGDAYDPAGKTKLYNVLAYVPASDLSPFTKGVACERCGSVSGDPIATALTDENGHFRLEGVPAGKKIPLVIQVGRWRRTIVLPEVKACTTTTLDAGVAHLPVDSSEGDIPQIAVVTGGFDELGCLLSRIGVTGGEYGTPGETEKRIHIYRGVGGGNYTAGGAPDATALWNDPATLAKYDMILLACEGWEYDEDDGTNGDKTAASKAAMRDWLAKGGRVFATHYHYTWFKKSPSDDFKNVATWNAPATAYGHRSLSVDTSFPKGAAFAKWLTQAGGSSTPGILEVDNPGANVAAVNAATTQRWLYDDKGVPYLSFNVPVGAPADQQCGRAVFSDIHVSGEQGGNPLPGMCGAAKLTPQELALEFLIFDLAACVQPDSQKPEAPH
jgi:hypothetical protein